MEKLKPSVLSCLSMFYTGEHELEFVDESYDHEYGTQQVFFYGCKYCPHTENYDYMEYEDDY